MEVCEDSGAKYVTCHTFCNLCIALELQGAAFNVTHFESRLTHLLYTAIITNVPGRWQHRLDCHGGHLQDIVLKT